MAQTIQITDVLGRTRSTDLYPDGSYNCPFCTSAVIAGKNEHCSNPACSVGAPESMREHFELQETEYEKRKQEEQARKRQHELAMARIAEDRRRLDDWLGETIAEAKRRGTCTNVKCLAPKYKGHLIEAPKFVRHRKPCPNEG